MAIIQPITTSEPPDFLTIGHVTRDVRLDGSFSLGGTVTFAALSIAHLGFTSAIVTCADQQLLPELPRYLPQVGIAVSPSRKTTTFANSYQNGFRTQYLRARADSQHFTDIPEQWRNAPIILLGPVAQEISPEFVTNFPRHPGTLLAATPQGWLRRWEADGRVWPTPWQEAEQLLPHFDVLILSHDDLLPFADGSRTEADAILSRWSMQVPLLVATDGRHGATLFQHGVTEHFPAYPVQEVDPTGAGDVFAASFLLHLHKHGNPQEAIKFANCVASFSIEREGTSGMPGWEMVEQRMRE